MDHETTYGVKCSLPTHEMRMTDMIEGPITVAEDMTIRGMVDGGVTVACNGAIVLHGMVDGDVIVEPGGSAIIHGMVYGAVVNRGGHVEVHGMVDSVRDSNDARTKIGAGAMVGQRL